MGQSVWTLIVWKTNCTHLETILYIAHCTEHYNWWDVANVSKKFFSGSVRPVTGEGMGMRLILKEEIYSLNVFEMRGLVQLSSEGQLRHASGCNSLWCFPGNSSEDIHLMHTTYLEESQKALLVKLKIIYLKLPPGNVQSSTLASTHANVHQLLSESGQSQT